MIFSRNRGSGKHARGEESRRSGPRHAAGRRSAEDGELGAYRDDADDPIERGPGPYDLVDAPTGVTRLDLGSLQIPAVDGVEVRVQASPEGQIQQVVLVHGESALQLGVFAAPRTEGIWDEVRTEIRKSMFDDGVAVEEIQGDHGVELRARVRTPDGLNDLRFVGVDGPRWMVRAIFQGPAAIDPGVAGPLADCLTGLVVNRGGEAMPVKDPLPLRLPKEMTEVQTDAAEAPPSTNGSQPRIDGRKPSPRPRRSG